MSLPAHVPEEDTDAMHALAVRMGRNEFKDRLQLEHILREQRGHDPKRGFWALEKRIDLYRCIRICLKCTGLWRRAKRNYFDIQVERNDVLIPGLPQAFDGYTILQLTDLHADLHPNFPAKVAQVIEPLKYDMLAVTGDFRTCTYGDHTGATQAAINILRNAKAPVYATLGNHDFLCKVPALEAVGVHFLLNENTAIQRGDDRLYIVGIDDPNFYKSHNFEHAMAGVPIGSCKILLSHSPQTYQIANELGFSFLMAGHTHGGQMCLPGGRVIVHDRSSPRRLLSGRWTEGKLQGYTSRGTGGTGLPARLNCPPEVTLHTLRCG